MKKLLVSGLIILSSLGFANDGHEGNKMEEILESRLEVKFEKSLGNEVEIDLEVADTHANVEIEVDGKTLPSNINPQNLAKEMSSYILNDKDSSISNVFIVFETESLFREDKVIYSETFTK